MRLAPFTVFALMAFACTAYHAGPGGTLARMHVIGERAGGVRQRDEEDEDGSGMIIEDDDDGDVGRGVAGRGREHVECADLEFPEEMIAEAMSLSAGGRYASIIRSLLEYNGSLF
jgi:hypothetical protein